jgi:MFS family permease
MSALIVGRAICGVGGVGMYIGVMTLLSLTTSIHERPNYIASTGIVWALGTVLGPVVGGAFSDSTATWRWAFYINICLGGVFAPVYLLLLPSIDPRPRKTFFKRLRETDILGGMLLIGAFVSGIMAISFGGTLYLWRSAQIIGCFLVSGTLFIVFGVQQAYSFLTTNERRIFPVEFLKSRTMVLLFCSMSCASTGLFIPIYMVPLFFQFTRSDTALDAAVRLLPFVFVSVFACLVNGAIMSKYGLYMPWYLAAGIFTTVGATLMSIVSENTSTSQIYGSIILLGFGVGLVLQASFSVAQANVPARKVSDAVGFITCAQVSSLTISLAIANSVFLNEAQNRISAFLPDVPLSTIQGAIAGVGSMFVAKLPNETRYLVLKAIVQSMSKVYILGISAGIFLILLSLGLRRERLFLTVSVIA